MLAQAARWLASSSQLSTPTEARIARLLNDLHTHLEMVEGLHESMRHAMDQAEESARNRVDPAPQQVLNAIEVVELDESSLVNLHQSAQCVICCGDFEVSERLSKLPGCGHLFHEACVMQWLERASNCPICRCNLTEAVTGRISRKAIEADLEEVAPGADSSLAASSSSSAYGNLPGSISPLAAHSSASSPLAAVAMPAHASSPWPALIPAAAEIESHASSSTDMS